MELFNEFFTGKYGLDWAAGVFMGLMLWRLGNHKRDGFIWSMLAAAAWIGFNIVVQSAAGILINAAMLVIAARSWLQWSGPPGGANAGEEQTTGS
ncbi:MAG: hypothetical protein AAGG07_03785 [Planctomycetota bacterium]